MEYLVWIGAMITLLGVVGLVWCVVIALRAKRQGLDENAMKSKLQRVVAINLGALLLSAFGLMMVVVGIFLS